MKRTIIVTFALALGLVPALARQCPKDMAKIDEAMKTAQLSAADKADVEKYRKEGDELHKAGKHPESEAILAKAKDILKIQ